MRDGIARAQEDREHVKFLLEHPGRRTVIGSPPVVVTVADRSKDNGEIRKVPILHPQVHTLFADAMLQLNALPVVHHRAYGRPKSSQTDRSATL